MRRPRSSVLVALAAVGLGNASQVTTPRPAIALISTRHAPELDASTDVEARFRASEIYLIDEDGSNARRLTNNAVPEGFPSLSPDGRRIVFDSGRLRRDTEPRNTSDLFVMDADGANQTALVRGSSATWSPDGRQIAFHASASGTSGPIKVDPGAATGDSDIFILDVEAFLKTGSKPRNLTNSPAAIDDDPDWSPRSAQIVFTSHAATDDPINSSTAELYVIDAGRGGPPRRLTTNQEEERGPQWSPDGLRILFSCRRGAPAPGSVVGTFELCVMNADGSGVVRLTTNAVPELTPSWSSDGRRIVFHRALGGRGQFQLFVINADGTGERQLTFPPGFNAFPHWGVVAPRAGLTGPTIR